ncbi:hypothetical protein DIE07_27550 [Burkholderia sp. Bp9002]|nr:hypothetical protein DIE07_27550 [Burkholderia sp. Bp9002]
MTGALGTSYNCHLSPKRAQLEAEGKWALNPLLRGDEPGYRKLEDYVTWYFTKNRGQMVRIKPTPSARTLTMGCRAR